MADRDGRHEVPEDQIPAGTPEELVDTEIKESADGAPPLERMDRAAAAPASPDPEDDLPPMDQEETTKLLNE